MVDAGACKGGWMRNAAAIDGRSNGSDTSTLRSLCLMHVSFESCRPIQHPCSPDKIVSRFLIKPEIPGLQTLAGKMFGQVKNKLEKKSEGPSRSERAERAQVAAKRRASLAWPSEPSEPARRVPRALGRRMCWVRLASPRARPC